VFRVNLLRIKKAESDLAKQSLDINCTFIANDLYFMEGMHECLSDDGIEYDYICEGVVPCLGELHKSELVELAKGIIKERGIL
jgi:hypothetical protein